LGDLPRLELATVDWVIVLGYICFSLAVGAFLARRAGRGVEEFFLSGRSLPWWLIGTSMGATSFAADTPLAVTEMVRTQGLAGNWLWWSYALGGMLSVFLFARLWRRARVVTDAEVTELRYAGRGAAILRGFRGIYFATVKNCLTMGWVILAMATLVEALFPEAGKAEAVVVSCTIALVYAVLSGFWGVIVTDLAQLVLALVGAAAAGFFAFQFIGGVEGLAAALPADRFADLVRPLPGGGEGALPIGKFFLFVGMIWWCSDNADGGGMIVQRISAARDEKEAVRGTLWFQFLHYVIRSWPWLLVALASVVIFPKLGDHKIAYPLTAILVLPAVWRGILVASILAAFMSTIDTHLNWGASYLVNDIYRRFLDPHATERRLVLVSRLATVVLMVLGGFVALQYKTITGAWILTISLGAGAGLVYILRWFWWRINAWSELSAMIGSLAANGIVQIAWPDLEFPYTLPRIVLLTAALWLPVTLLTAPVEMARLERFWKQVRPPGFWGPVRGAERAPSLARPIGRWLLGSASIFGFLIGSAWLFFGKAAPGIALVAVSAAIGVYLLRKIEGVET